MHMYSLRKKNYDVYVYLPIQLHLYVYMNLTSVLIGHVNLNGHLGGAGIEINFL